MSTPMRLTTPRRLFSPKPPTSSAVARTRRRGWVRMSGNPAKRRRLVATATGRRGVTRRRPTVRQIVQDMSQEKKRRERFITLPDIHNALSYLIGDDIPFTNGTGVGAPGALDAATSTKETNMITITGIGLKGHFRSTELPTNTTVVKTNPTQLKWYIVSTTREGNPLDYWYQQRNSDTNNSYGDFTNDTIGDRLRQERRVNRLDIKILASGSHKVTHANFATTQIGHFVHINRYIKCNIKIHYNAARDAGLPYGATVVRPNIWLVTMVQNPDEGTTTANEQTDGRINVTTYFRE